MLANSRAEWLFIRLRAVVDAEASSSASVVSEYYEQLRHRNNQRAVLPKDAV